MNNFSVSELRQFVRNKDTKFSGLQIAGMRKSELVDALMGIEPIPDKPAESNDNLADIIAKALQGKIKTESIDINKVREIVKEELSLISIPEKLEIKLPDNTVKEITGQHKDFKKLLMLTGIRSNIMLVGPAGSGKTTVCHNISDALNLPFFMTSVGLQTTKSDLLGYMDATGKYVKTHLRQAYEHGGVFLLDEIDAGNSNVLTVLNSLLANGLGAFPDLIIKRHPDFIFIAAANTYGRGVDRQYIGRNQLDASTLDRFIVVNFDYDIELEKRLTGNDKWVEKVQGLREKAYNLKLNIVISPRASITGNQLLQLGFSENEILDMVIFKGINQEVKNKILGE